MKFSIFTGEKKSLYIAWASFRNGFEISVTGKDMRGKLYMNTLKQIVIRGANNKIISLKSIKDIAYRKFETNCAK